MTEHKHAWRMTLHLDGCHFYQSAYSCSCGATASTYDERDAKADAWSAVWMAEDGAEPCERCDALMAGAEPTHEQVVTEAAT